MRTRRQNLGQHFLKDHKTIEKILESFLSPRGATPARHWLEIGPGPGALTYPLLKKKPENTELLLVERDHEFVERWKKEVPTSVRVLEADMVGLDPAEWLPPQREPLSVISNLPYSAGTAIVLKLAQFPDRISHMVLMFQKEVADRISAGPREEGRGSLSVFIQNLWDVKPALHVPPGAFSPPPKVDSQVLVLLPRSTPWISQTQESPEAKVLWERLLQDGFRHRRKMLRASFKGNPRLTEALKVSGVDPTLRAEALDWPEWEALFRSLWSC